MEGSHRIPALSARTANSRPNRPGVSNNKPTNCRLGSTNTKAFRATLICGLRTHLSTLFNSKSRKLHTDKSADVFVVERTVANNSSKAISLSLFPEGHRRNILRSTACRSNGHELQSWRVAASTALYSALSPSPPSGTAESAASNHNDKLDPPPSDEGQKDNRG